MKNTTELMNILTLEQCSDTIFQGHSKSVGTFSVFGGQVLAQAVSAVMNTVSDNRFLHSLHSYFLAPGDLEIPITYEVECVRDGGSFSTRRATAKQGDTTIFILAASFHKKEEGHSHQIDFTKEIKQPEDLLSWTDIKNQMGDFLPKQVKGFLSIPRPIDFKPTVFMNPLDPKDLEPRTNIWFKFKVEDANAAYTFEQKQQMLTYASDYNVLTTALFPHASKANFYNTQMASLDHAMWFFNDFDINDWLLLAVESPCTTNARGFARANIYTREGILVASITQEGLMRPLKQ